MYSVDLYARVRRACHVERMSKREAARVFGIDRKTVDKMLAHSVPPGYRRSRLSTAVAKGATRRSKSGPLCHGEELVPVVHGRGPRAQFGAC
jgi:hypothetical protein